MNPIKRAVVVLDQASGQLREDDGEIIGFDLRPDARMQCEDCLAKGLEIILAVPGLADAGFGDDLSEFAQGMQVVPLAPLSYASGAELSGLTGLQAADLATALVSADRQLRGQAHTANMVPVPHAALLPLLAQGIAPIGARIWGARAAIERLPDVVAMQFQPIPGAKSDWAMIALVAPSTLVDAALLGLSVIPLDYDPLVDDLVWIRIDVPPDQARADLAGRKILFSEPGQMLIALGPEEDAQALHVHGAHGHSEALIPDPGLLRPPAWVLDEIVVDREIGRVERILEPVIRSKVAVKILRQMRPSCSQLTAQYGADLDRYTGVTALDAQGPIVSRHTAHPDNKRAEAALLKDLHDMGYCAFRHTFTHAGATHSNIIADLPGAGRLRIRPDILKKYRHILKHPRLPDPIGPLEREIESLLPGGFDLSALDASPTPLIRRELELIFRLRPWYPWWKRLCSVPGIGADLVIVGAHMDSTAAFGAGYNPVTDPAPGRDDNGSGLAGVLSLARYFAGLQGKLTHTVRFCFFNAEEAGLVGSKAYASHLKAMNAPVRAAYCIDMMGYNSDANRIFEIHAGYTDPAVRDLSVPFAQKVATAAAGYGQLAPAQIYRGTGYGGSPDRTVFDGAINRSDHAAFHQQGYPAVLASEDFFANLASEPTADPNPNYHKPSDVIVDLAYARDITCAIARAVTTTAL